MTSSDNPINWRDEMNQENLNRLIEMCGRAYALAVAVQMGDKVEAGLDDEVAGEMAEFLAHLDGDTASMPDEDAIDAQLRDMAQELRG
jgi:hypothetical protein